MEILNPNTNEVETPVVPVLFSGEQVILTYFNSRIRTFREPHEIFNHTEFIDSEGELQGTTNKELMNILFGLDWPMLSMPYVDDVTFEWFAETEVFDLANLNPEDFQA